MAQDRITPARMHKRAEALEECAEHLGQDWTEDPEEREEGGQLAEMLRAEAAVWRERAHAFSGWPAGPYTIGHRTQREKKQADRRQQRLADVAASAAAAVQRSAIRSGKNHSRPGQRTRRRDSGKRFS